MNQRLRVAVIGSTGAVGQELLTLLHERQFPFQSITGLTSSRSAGLDQSVGAYVFSTVELNLGSVGQFDLAFFSAGSRVSQQFAPLFAEQGAWIIDNSSAFRMDDTVPLIVPEINSEKLVLDQKIFSNPNCTAIILSIALNPLRALGTISRIIVSTYQSASGAGALAMQELIDQTEGYLKGDEPPPKVLPHPYAFNLFSHNTPINADGQNEEEVKVTHEVRKIMSMPDLGVNVTCVRVPVLRAHAESVTIEFDSDAPSLEAVYEAMAQAPGVRLVDDRDSNTFPMPRSASGGDDVLVGRLRHDPSNQRALCMFICGDQLRKGAALNAIQIAECLVEMRGRSQKVEPGLPAMP